MISPSINRSSCNIESGQLENFECAVIQTRVPHPDEFAHNKYFQSKAASRYSDEELGVCDLASSQIFSISLEQIETMLALTIASIGLMLTMLNK